MSDTIIVSTELTKMTCACCAGVFAISSGYLEEARRKGGFRQCWTCPYCKTDRGYGEDTISKLKTEIAQLEVAKQRLAQDVNWADGRRAEAEAEREHFRKSRDGMKGALVRTKQRVGTGTCPCCNCVFPNLHFHMATQHPGYKSEEALA